MVAGPCQNALRRRAKVRGFALQGCDESLVVELLPVAQGFGPRGGRAEGSEGDACGAHTLPREIDPKPASLHRVRIPARAPGETAAPACPAHFLVTLSPLPRPRFEMRSPWSEGDNSFPGKAAISAQLGPPGVGDQTLSERPAASSPRPDGNLPSGGLPAALPSSPPPPARPGQGSPVPSFSATSSSCLTLALFPSENSCSARQPAHPEGCCCGLSSRTAPGQPLVPLLSS